MVRSLQPRPAMTDAAVGLAVAIALTIGVGLAGSRFWIVDRNLVNLLGFLAVWVPLVTAVVVATLRHGSGSPVRDFGLRFHPLDLLWGLAIGLLARVVATLIETVAYGAPAGPPVRFVTAIDAWWVFAALLAPVLIGPIVEELFFRGLVLRATLARFGSPVLAVILSGVVFAVAHLVQPSLGTGTLSVGAGTVAIGLSTLVFGLAVAALAVLTGRVGGAVVAHMMFNGLAVVPGVVG